LAKQLGVGDEALSGLKDPAHHPFPPDQKAALLFADAMTSGPGQVPDSIYAGLRRHFSEAQIVEIATVVGLFNYFNRFNNALHVEVTLMDPGLLLRRVEEAAATAAALSERFDRVAGILKEGRRYLRLEIGRGTHLPAEASGRGAAALTVPIAVKGKVVGWIRVESDREIAADDEERSLLVRAAEILAAGML
jgi:hypothetical protein